MWPKPRESGLVAATTTRRNVTSSKIRTEAHENFGAQAFCYIYHSYHLYEFLHLSLSGRYDVSYESVTEVSHLLQKREGVSGGFSTSVVKCYVLVHVSCHSNALWETLLYILSCYCFCFLFCAGLRWHRWRARRTRTESKCDAYMHLLQA